jgi:lipopolysaccharide/colanic/teichoic acid biosynthesis glycosyltransferase
MIKRLFDILVSGSVLLVLLLPGLLIMLLLRLTGEGEIFYFQKRIGLHGKIFKVFKFATMLVGSETMGNKDITVRNDPRVTAVGKVLRKTKVNELPQLINVFKGDMSMVGWRPLVPAGFDHYSEEVKTNIVKNKPGLTGIGSIVFRDEEHLIEHTTKEPRDCYAEDISPYKGQLEMWYGEKKSFWLDMKIIVCTALVILMPNSNIYQRMFPDLPQPPADGEIARIRSLAEAN